MPPVPWQGTRCTGLRPRPTSSPPIEPLTPYAEPAKTPWRAPLKISAPAWATRTRVSVRSRCTSRPLAKARARSLRSRVQVEASEIVATSGMVTGCPGRGSFSSCGAPPGGVKASPPSSVEVAAWKPVPSWAARAVVVIAERLRVPSGESLSTTSPTRCRVVIATSPPLRLVQVRVRLPATAPRPGIRTDARSLPRSMPVFVVQPITARAVAPAAAGSWPPFTSVAKPEPRSANSVGVRPTPRSAAGPAARADQVGADSAIGARSATVAMATPVRAVRVLSSGMGHPSARVNVQDWNALL